MKYVNTVVAAKANPTLKYKWIPLCCCQWDLCQYCIEACMPTGNSDNIGRPVL